MKPLVFNFYHRHDIVAEDGKSLDCVKLTKTKPIDSIKARADVVLKAQLSHLGFFISRVRPDLENEVLAVELNFRVKECGCKIPMLAVSHNGVDVFQRRLNCQSIDSSPFISLLLKRNAHLKNTDLLFTLSEATGKD